MTPERPYATLPVAPLTLSMHGGSENKASTQVPLAKIQHEPVCSWAFSSSLLQIIIEGESRQPGMFSASPKDEAPMPAPPEGLSLQLPKVPAPPLPVSINCVP